MKRIIWKDDFELGIEQIDLQHKHLVDIINRLAVCLENSFPSAGLDALLEEYLRYAESHFVDEEAYMNTIGYPERTPHAELHKGFSTQISGFRKRLAERDSSLVSELSDFLEFWLIDHIVINDSLYASHAGTRDEAHVMV